MKEDIASLQGFLDGISILCVEDEESVRHMLKQILEKFTPLVQEASNGKEALQIYEKKPADLIITDLNMPVMGGLELIRHIKKDNPFQKIIVLSAYGDMKNLLEAINLGVDGYIVKPLSIERLIGALKRVGHYIRLEKENHQCRLSLEEQLQAYKKELEKKSQQLLYQLQYDALTSLPNKNRLLLDFEEKKFRSMIYIDIDNMDFININFGFEVGDRALKQIAKKIQELLPSSYFLYRIINDEFAICSKEKSLQALKTAHNVSKAIEEFRVPEIGFNLTATIAVVPVEEKIPFDKAHLTLKQAQKRGKKVLCFKEVFVEEFRKKDLAIWIRKVQDGFKKERFVPFFQPIVNAKTKRVEKYEVLVRLKDKDKIVSPFFFLEAVDFAGLMPELTKRMIQKSFETFASTSFSFSINISQEDLKANYLRHFLLQQCERYDIEPGRVMLEILESMSNEEYNLLQLQELKKSGFLIAIDDFGTQGANFLRLHQFPVDVLKIDGTFIKDLDVNQDSFYIVDTIIHYAKHKGIQTVAEFVHNEAIAKKVQEIGVDYLQGYYFGEPKERLKG